MGKDSGIIEVKDKKYPEALKQALKKLQPHLGQKRLFYKGNWPVLSKAEGTCPEPAEGTCPEPAEGDDIFKNCLAVVGSRHLTSYGRRVTEQFVTEIAAAGVTIVSGFMYGGDEAAHSAAVKCRGRTIAVMPCGIDIIHPANQKKLYQEILDNNGLIISEYEGDTQPQNFTYVQRDRIIAGLSKAVLVTEAALNSGSLITAGYGRKYGRKIFAIPGQITSEVSKGTIKLIKEGAEVATEANDILSYFKVLVNPTKAKGLPMSPSWRTSGVPQTSSILEQKIIDQLKRESMKADEMARCFSIPVAKIGTALSLMQLKGFINQDNGKYYVN
ncbi:MAG: DNA protecting protein DprA [Candidatus Staskawiczbacteria bacterium RIFCSPLOWO2_12_FULL_37_15]|uniref:DNA protecting protein DprA n=1 Tax=Candidatus Staskawiczbacteria bacterium RIFCSPLOWO2_12_FULL_37_15 TaxID=1802218 RepID=A0A1G2IM74_9BACT|nr:MAG: DNA protecting protein DprA [Candidatus Staskawiczbacteria bacterium RIFCSPLOWO2_12_FULL_37_15]